jgi:hypothetical protein
MIFGKTTVRDDLLLGSLIVLVLAVVLPTSPRRLKLREATSGGPSSKRPGLVTKVIDLSTGVAEPWMPAGEPLHHVAALSVVSRRLPRTSRRLAVLSLAVIPLVTRRHHGQGIETIPGSRPLPDDRVATLQSGFLQALMASTHRYINRSTR